MIFDDILDILKNDNSIAYTEKGKKYTYKELYNAVCNIYSLIKARANGSNPIVVYGKKEVYVKASFLACSFLGYAYVPIDKSMAKSRVDSIISQVEPSLIIGDYELNGTQNITEEELILCVENDSYCEINDIKLMPNDVCYMIFTSGSTGAPKGVSVSYENLDSCTEWLKTIYNKPHSVVLNQAKFSFDLSVADFYLSLVTASEHYIIDSDTIDFSKMFKSIGESKANIAVMTPSFADLLLLDKSFNSELMPRLEMIIFCGETLLVKTAKELHNRFKDIKIINCYGPTECTFAVTKVEIDSDMEKLSSLPIGRAKKDVEIVIVDDKKQPLPNGEAGEIMIVGKSVALGYLNTDSDAFTTFNSKKAYLTGDIGYLQNDMLYYKCRKDNQIKYKGYRIELNDIEQNLSKLSYIERAVVAPKYDGEKVSRIMAFVKLKENESVKPMAIKRDLLKMIPDYMCPVIKIINNFELNQNGKCDVKKLMEEYSK